MQTFLPYEDFESSAHVLDYQRLGKQRLEAKSILRINLGEAEGGAWRNHPAVVMWKGFEPMLAFYGLVITSEWCRRGYRDQQYEFFLGTLQQLGWGGHNEEPLPRPSWLGREDFHRSHRANLLRKAPNHYGRYWSEDPSLPYVWPSKES